MLKIFDRKLDYHSLMIYPTFIYLLFTYYFSNWITPPPGIPIIVWIPMFCEILGNFLDIRIASRGLLQSTILQLCEQRNSQETGVYPTLNDVYNVIKDSRFPLMSHYARHQETIINRLEGLITVFGDHICSQRPIDWNLYMNSNLAISLDGIPTDYQNIFITVEISKILLYRMANNERSERLRDLIVFDEASSIFKPFYENRETTFLLTDYLSKAREFGIGFIIASQHLNIADSVMANTGIKIMVGGLGLGKDYDKIASATGMTKDQKEFLRQLTRPGQACVKDPRYPYPFTLEVPKIA